MTKGNLILTVKNTEMIKIGEEIFITLLGRGRVAIECPKEIPIHKELKPNVVKRPKGLE